MVERRLGDASVEEIELMYRKSARGDSPKVGDVLLRAQNGWIFSPAIIDVGAIEFEGALGAGKPIGDTGFVKISGENAVPPSEADIYDNVVELGAGNIIEEDVEDGELLFKAGGLITISATITYQNMAQEALFRINILRNGNAVPIASSIADISGAATFFVATVQFIGLFQAGDRIFTEFGRLNEAPFTADIVTATLLAYVVSLDVRP